MLYCKYDKLRCTLKTYQKIFTRVRRCVGISSICAYSSSNCLKRFSKNILSLRSFLKKQKKEINKTKKKKQNKNKKIKRERKHAKMVEDKKTISFKQKRNC